MPQRYRTKNMEPNEKLEIGSRGSPRMPREKNGEPHLVISVKEKSLRPRLHMYICVYSSTLYYEPQRKVRVQAKTARPTLSANWWLLISHIDSEAKSTNKRTIPFPEVFRRYCLIKATPHWTIAARFSLINACHVELYLVQYIAEVDAAVTT